MQEQHAAMQRLLASYHDGQLEAERATEVQVHLAACPECRQELAALQVLSELLAGQPLPASLEHLDLGPAILGQLGDRAEKRQEPAGLGLLGWLGSAGLVLGQAALQVMGFVALAIWAASGMAGIDWAGWLASGLGLDRLPSGLINLPQLPVAVDRTLTLLASSALLLLLSLGLLVLYLTWLALWRQREMRY